MENTKRKSNKSQIRNPLIKRIPREMLGDWKKYLVVSLFLILTIGFVSGMYVANGSMMKAADEGVEKYKLEDGHFELKNKADKELISAVESGEKADMKQYYLDTAKKSWMRRIRKHMMMHGKRFSRKLMRNMQMPRKSMN